MNPKGSIRLFKVAGITVWMNWLWLFYLFARMMNPSFAYQHTYWKVIECVSVFGIVLLHEFGHSFATRSVGGTSEDIVLSLFGGVSYCDPPRRPGAMLWSIVAGPLVNVVLIPFFYALAYFGFASNADDATDPQLWLYYLSVMNIIMLLFNLLPIYPLDGGKILWSLLWFIVGEGRSLKFASVLGMILSVAMGVAGVIFLHGYYLAALSAMLAFGAYGGYKQGCLIRENELYNDQTFESIGRQN